MDQGHRPAGYDEKDLPSNEGKRNLYEMGKQRFLELGYEEIGMDHFALPSDDLAKASTTAPCTAISWATPQARPS